MKNGQDVNIQMRRGTMCSFNVDMCLYTSGLFHQSDLSLSRLMHDK